MTWQMRNQRRLLEIEDSETRASQSYSKFLILLLPRNQVKLLRRHELTPLTFSPLFDIHSRFSRWILRCTGAHPVIFGVKFSADPELLRHMWRENSIGKSSSLIKFWQPSGFWRVILQPDSGGGGGPSLLLHRVLMLGFAQQEGKIRSHTWRVLVAGEDPKKTCRRDRRGY